MAAIAVPTMAMPVAMTAPDLNYCIITSGGGSHANPC